MEVDGSDWRAQFQAEDELPADASTGQKASRGRRLEGIFHQLLDEADLQPRLAFRPTGEEIDGSFVLDGRTMLFELKWRAARQPASALYQFTGKVAGKLVGTLGLFVSMSGYSSDAVDALVVGKNINIVLMDGDDLRAVVRGDVDFKGLLRRKLRAAAEAGTPYVPWDEIAVTGKPEQVDRQVVLTEGRLDERILRLASSLYGETPDRQTFMPVAGPRNFAPVVESLVPMLASPAKFVVVAEADGDPNGTRERIEEDFAQRVPTATVHILVLDPDLEVLVGLFKPGEFAAGRRKVLDLSDELLRRRLEQGLPTAAQEYGAQLLELSEALQLRLPGIS